MTKNFHIQEMVGQGRKRWLEGGQEGKANLSAERHQLNVAEYASDSENSK